jgi:hypothetical protein
MIYSIQKCGDVICSYDALIRDFKIENFDYKIFKSTNTMGTLSLEVMKERDWYSVFLRKNPNSVMRSFQTINICINEFFTDPSQPNIVYTAENCKSEDGFFKIDIDNGRLELAFSSDYKAIYNRNTNIIKVFNINDIECKDLLEYYIITDNGFVSSAFNDINDESDVKSNMLYGDTYVIFDQIGRCSKSIGCPSLDFNSRRITYIDKNKQKTTYICKFDEYGIMCSCYIEDEHDKDKKEELCKYNRIENKSSNDIDIQSIHPHLYDIFNHNLMATPEENYWVVEDISGIMDLGVNYYKEVLQLDKSKMDDVLEFIRSYHPIGRIEHHIW